MIGVSLLLWTGSQRFSFPPEECELVGLFGFRHLNYSVVTLMHLVLSSAPRTDRSYSFFHLRLFLKLRLRVLTAAAERWKNATRIPCALLPFGTGMKTLEETRGSVLVLPQPFFFQLSISFLTVEATEAWNVWMMALSEKTTVHTPLTAIIHAVDCRIRASHKSNVQPSMPSPGPYLLSGFSDPRRLEM